MTEIITGPSGYFAQQQQQPDLVGNLSHLLALKQQQQLAPLQLQQAQQNVQSGQLDIQQKQREADSSAAIQKAYMDSNGDLSKAISDAAKSGKALPGDLAKLQQIHFQVQEQAYKTLQEKGNRAIQEADFMDGAADAVKNAPPEQRPAVYQQQIANLQKAGVDVSQVPPQYPGDQAFGALSLGLKSHKNAIEQAAKQAETQKNVAQTQEAQAGTQQKQAETSFYQQNGGAPGVSAEIQQQADWLKKNPGKGPSDYKLWVMKNSPSAIVMGNQLGGSGKSDALDFAAENYRQTGQMPAGFSRSPGTTSAVIARAAELDKQNGGSGIAANKSVLESNKKSLDSIQKNFDNVTAFENTAGKNLDTFINTAKSVIDSGSPLINSPLRNLSNAAIGSDKMAAFNAARATALTEIAKVLNSSNASGVLSDSARHEVEGLIGPNATLKQIYSAANILKQDMRNRHESYQQQINDIQGRIKNNGGASATPAGPSSTSPVKITLPSGKTISIE
jgi:hypothetical protein